MGLYEFHCLSCDEKYSDICPYDETGKYKKVRCPECGSKKKEKLVSVCNFAFAQPEGTSRWISDSKGHDYRYQHKAPSVRKEREQAEKKSHMGSGKEIYREIDDISKGNSFDFSKI
jgi:putative FmdB family regulatory protein